MYMPEKVEKPNRLKATVFHALSDPVRLEILEFLRDGEKCVCDIIPQLNLIQPVVSRHLRILKDSGIVKDRKDGNKRLYSITDSRIYKIMDIITPELSETLTKEILNQMVCQ
jgi:ArsR family transcriptional regulator